MPAVATCTRSLGSDANVAGSNPSTVCQLYQLAAFCWSRSPFLKVDVYGYLINKGNKQITGSICNGANLHSRRNRLISTTNITITFATFHTIINDTFTVTATTVNNSNDAVSIGTSATNTVDVTVNITAIGINITTNTTSTDTITNTD